MPTFSARTARCCWRRRGREDDEMARIELDLAHSYKPNPQQDSDYALLPLSMVFEDGGAYALLGPSGCGKTTMLNIMSGRSEEHTSELQSPCNLVCRLLLEKKKNNIPPSNYDLT